MRICPCAIFSMAGFSITVDAAAGRAEGWFVRENRPFLLDVEAGTVNAADSSYELRPDDVRVEEDDIYVLPQRWGSGLMPALRPAFPASILML